MPVWKFRSLDRAAAGLPAAPPGETALRTALTLSALDEAGRSGVRVSLRGVHKYRTVAEGEAERERYALAQLRAAGPATTPAERVRDGAPPGRP
jgi:hypothetical protein